MLTFSAIITLASVNLLPNASFEAGIEPHGAIVSGSFADESARPKVTIDDTTAAHGKRSVKIDASGGGSFEFLSPDVEIDPKGNKVAFSAYFKSDRPVKVRLGAFGYHRDEKGKEVYTGPGKYFEISNEWQRAVLDKIWVDGKCGRISLKIMGSGPCVLWLDGIQLEKSHDPAKPFAPMADVEAVWSMRDHVFTRGEGETVEATAQLTSIDYGTGKVAVRGEKFAIVSNGIFTLDKTVEVDGRKLRPFPCAYAAVARVPQWKGGGFALGGNGLTGISLDRKTHGQVYTAPAGYGLEEYFRDIRKFGMRYVRFHDGNLQWRDMTNERGVYDWRATDRVVTGCCNAGLEPMFLFASHGIFINSRWDDWRYANWHVRKDSARAPKGPFHNRRYFLPKMEDWREFISAAVGRYGNVIRYWEIVNEPNITMSTPEAYADYAREAYKTVKSLKPDAVVVGLCVTGDFGARPGSFLAKLEKTDAFANMDAASLHPYDAPLDFGKIAAEDALAEFIGTVHRHRPGIEIMQNELYYLFTDKEEKDYFPVRNLVRRYATDMGMGLSVSAPLWFGAHYGADAGHVKSLLPQRVSVHFMPNERFIASAAFASFLEGGKAVGKIQGLPEGMNGYAYRDRDGREISLVWMRDPKSAPVRHALKPGAKAYDIFGNPIPGDTAIIGADPIYLFVRGEVEN